MDDFDQVVLRVCAYVTVSLDNGSALNAQLNQESDSICIKSVERKNLVCNKAFESTWGDSNSTLGRSNSSYLQQSIETVSRQSDAMILNGCQTVQFEHIGHDAQGRELRMRSYKRSLLGLGHPTMAILVIARVLEVITNSGAIRLGSLMEQWKLFCKLDEIDRAIVVGVARGNSVADIAAQQSVSKKTIENHRSAILKTLELDSSVELIKLVVRLQENGFGDFGV